MSTPTPSTPFARPIVGPPNTANGDSGAGGQNDYAKWWEMRPYLRNLIVADYNARFYGAVGDGVHDDTAAILAAIADAQVAGGRVFLPAGNYLITSTLTINTASVRLVGEGRSITRIIIATSFTPIGGIVTGTVLGAGIVFSQADFCAIEQLTIKGQNTGSVGANANVSGVQVVSSRYFHVDTMDFTWLNGYGLEVMGSHSLSPFASFYGSANDLRMENSLAGMHLLGVTEGGFGCQFKGVNINVGTNIGPVEGFLIEDCNDVAISNYLGPLHVLGGSAISIASFDSGLVSSSNTCVLIEASANTGPTRVALVGGVTTEGVQGIHIGAGCGTILIESVNMSNYTTYGLQMESGSVIVNGCGFNTASGIGTGAFDILSNTFHTNNIVQGCLFTSAIGTIAGKVQAPVSIAQRDFTTWSNNIFVNGSATTSFTGPNPVWNAYGNRGYNPVGNVSVTVGASPYTIPSKGYYVTYYVTGGTVSSISVGGVTLTGITNGPIRVPPQTAAIITHTGAPTVVGFGD